MSHSTASWDRRICRLCEAVGEVELTHPLTTEPLIAVTSSRLGHDWRLHRDVCQFLCRCLLDARTRNASLLVASGSAIEPWAARAAELFAVPLLRMSVYSPSTDSRDPSVEIVARSPNGSRLSRDAAVIGLADRVDAVYVRPGGTIERWLRRRIELRGDATTRVAMTSIGHCAAPALIAVGAIGWFRLTVGSVETNLDAAGDVGEKDAEDETVVADESDAWTRTDGQWLIHCTRGRWGAWPGETDRQYRDSILLGDESSPRRGPLDALERIVRGGRIVAGATTSSHRHPVVCFSAQPLQELLERRCFRPHLGRWDYEPFGVAISIRAARSLKVAPVIYGPPEQRAAVRPADQFRFHPVGSTFDWRWEREWRSPQSVDLSALQWSDVRVFAEDQPAARRELRNCPWQVTFVSVPPRARKRGGTDRGKWL